MCVFRSALQIRKRFFLWRKDASVNYINPKWDDPTAEILSVRGCKKGRRIGRISGQTGTLPILFDGFIIAASTCALFLCKPLYLIRIRCQAKILNTNMIPNKKRSVTNIQRKSIYSGSIGQRIRQIRNEKGLSQNNFANIIGISQNYLSQIENDKFKPAQPLLIFM